MHVSSNTIYMDAVLRPNASLSPRGFAIIMTAIGTISFLVGVAFISLGALPIAGFMGLDALAVWLAFRHSFNRQREHTHIVITGDTLSLRHVKPCHTDMHVEFPSAFVRVELTEPATPQSWLRIEHGQRAFVIGRFLTIKERQSLARAIRAALQKARSERYISPG